MRVRDWLSRSSLRHCSSPLESPSSLANSIEIQSPLFACIRHIHIIHDNLLAASTLRRLLELCTNIHKMRYDLLDRDTEARLLDLFPISKSKSLRDLHSHNYGNAARLFMMPVCITAPGLEVLSYHGVLSPQELDHPVTGHHGTRSCPPAFNSESSGTGSVST